MARTIVVVAFLAVAAGPLAAQATVEDPNVPRPPYLLGVSRAERIEAAVQFYLSQLIQAIQTADTAALSALVPDDVIPAAEKPVAQRAGCASVGDAVRQVRVARAGQARWPEVPLGMIHLGDAAVDLTVRGDTVATASARIREKTERELLYAPIRLAFLLDGGRILVGSAKGVLVGACGWRRQLGELVGNPGRGMKSLWSAPFTEVISTCLPSLGGQ